MPADMATTIPPIASVAIASGIALTSLLILMWLIQPLSSCGILSLEMNHSSEFVPHHVLARGEITPEVRKSI